MPRLIPPPIDADALLIPPEDPDVPHTYFRLISLPAGQCLTVEVPGYELLAVVLSGSVHVSVGETDFGPVGQRSSVWGGPADAVYAGTGRPLRLAPVGPTCEIAITGGRCDAPHPPFRIRPEEVQSIEVGSLETHTQRTIHHILGQNAAGRAGHLLVSELYAAPGCWSGYPPHKHDTENPPDETAFEEVYHYRFEPETGFGGQYTYRPGHPAQCAMTTHRSTFVVDAGYHPTSTSPGHRGYILTILVGKFQRSLIQYFEEKHLHLCDQIPGLAAMREKFR